ncbi:oxidoreductase [Amycolatopsis sp. NPDC051903]|uniref:oxidoreductase n=1 Tax=Amycolatopsis sp. NPDC051903 TaxID=3363936 RepID=UPI00378B5691
MSVWFVTGSSRGFGAEIVRAALAAGHRVVATARDPEAVRARFLDAGEALLALPLDVTDPASAQAAADAAVARFGRLDVVVNNAGRGLLGAVEEGTDEEIRALYETNVFGVLAVLRAVLPVLRRQRSGHVLNISSVGGFASAPGWGLYASTKFAVEGYSEALAGELAPLGVDVTIVEPGYFRTDFLDPASLATGASVIDDYAATAGSMRSAVPGLNHAQPGDPVKAAAQIVRFGGSTNPPLRLPLGSDCVAEIERKLEHVTAELKQLRDVSLSTDFAG